MDNKYWRFFALWGILLCCFVFDTVVWPIWSSASWIVPYGVAVWVFGAAMYRWKRFALGSALAIGLVYDVLYYGQMIGVHALAYALAVGVLMIVHVPDRWSGFVVAQAIGVAVVEFVVWGCYALFGLTDVRWEWLIVSGVLPSMVCAVGLALAMIKPMRWVYVSVPVHQDEQFGV